MRGDALSGDGLQRALAGVEVAYYLIHSMERATAGARSRLRRARAPRRRELRRGGRARAGVRRIVYLGGLVPRWGEGATARRCRPAQLGAPRQPRGRSSGSCSPRVPDSLALRASIVIGARSRSFRLLVRLVERMPVLTLPAWQRFPHPADRRARRDRDARRVPRRARSAGARSRSAGPTCSATARCSHASPS